MSRISELAATFEQKSTTQAAHTEQVVQDAFRMHENALLQALNESEKKTSAAIAAQHQSLRQSALKTWMFIAISLALVLLLGGGIIWSMGRYIEHQVYEIASNKLTLEKIHKQGGSMDLGHCGNDRRLCVKIDKSAEQYEGGYQIPEGY